MERVFKFLFLFSVVNLRNLINCENVAVKIFPENVVNVVSEKFISFTIDPAILMNEKDGDKDDCMCMAMSLSPAYVRIAGESTNDLRLKDFLQNKKPALPHLQIEDSLKPRYLFKRSAPNNFHLKSFEELRDELRNSEPNLPLKRLEELRETLKPRHEIPEAHWPFRKLENLRERVKSTVDEVAEESNPPLTKLDLVPQNLKPFENFGIDKIPPLKFEDFKEPLIPRHESIADHWPFKKLDDLHERAKSIDEFAGVQHPPKKLDLIPSVLKSRDDLAINKIPPLKFEDLKEPAMLKEDTKHPIGVRNNLNKYIDWLRTANFTPVIALSYADKIAGGSWNPTTALKVLSIADKLRTGECVWQLGNVCLGQTSEKYVKDLKTLKIVMDAFAAGKNGAWKVATGDIVQCLGNAPADQLKEFLMSSSKISDSIVIDSGTTGEIFNGLSTEDKANIKNELLLNGGTALWKTVRCDESKSKEEEAISWLNALGESAMQGYSVVFKDLKEKDIFEPSMLYYVSLLHKKLVGQKVLNVQNVQNSDNVSVYSHCASLPSGPLSGGVTVFAVNRGTEKSSISIKMTVKEPGSEIMQYVLASNKNGQYFVNGKELKEESYMEPLVKQVRAFNTLTVTLPPKAVGFWVIVNANAESCMINSGEHNQEGESKIHQQLQMEGSQGINHGFEARKKRSANNEDDVSEFEKNVFVENEQNFQKIKEDAKEVLNLLKVSSLSDELSMKDSTKKIKTTTEAENVVNENTTHQGVTDEDHDDIDDFSIDNTDLFDQQESRATATESSHNESFEDLEPYDINDHKMELMMIRAGSESMADYHELFSLVGQLTSMLKLEKEFLDIGNAILKPVHHQENDTKSINGDEDKTEVKREKRDLEEITPFVEDSLKTLESKLLPEISDESVAPGNLLSKLKIPDYLKISLPKKGECIQGLVKRAENILNNLDKNALADSVNAESRMAEPSFRFPLRMEPIAEKINLKTQLLRNRAKIDELKHKMKTRLADMQIKLRRGLHHNLLKREIQSRHKNKLQHNFEANEKVHKAEESSLKKPTTRFANKNNALRKYIRKIKFVPKNKMELIKRSKRFITFDASKSLDTENDISSDGIDFESFGFKGDKKDVNNNQNDSVVKKDIEDKIDSANKRLKEVVRKIKQSVDETANNAKESIDPSSNEVPKWNRFTDLDDDNFSAENDDDSEVKSPCELAKIAQEKLTAEEMGKKITDKLGIPDDMIESVVKSVTNFYEKAKSKVGDIWKTLGFNS